MSNAQKRIAGALLAGAALIAGALLIRSYTQENIQGTSTGIAVVAEAPERTSIKTLDQNNDGVPDWQESLLVTEALHIASTTSDYTEPETLTEQFALDFFQEMVRAENYGAFGDTQEELVLSASEALAKEAVDELLTVEDTTVSDNNSLESLIQYGETIAEITTRYPISSINEALILEEALRAQNPAELTKLDEKIKVYSAIIADTQALPVPNSLQQEHLNLLNSYQAILNDIIAMRNAFTDPMMTLLRMKRYQDDATGLSVSFTNIYSKLENNGATWTEGSPVFLFIQVN